jgi:hypothetical protein
MKVSAVISCLMAMAQELVTARGMLSSSVCTSWCMYKLVYTQYTLPA